MRPENEQEYVRYVSGRLPRLHRTAYQPGEPVGVADTGLVVGSRLDGSPGALTWHCDR
jgi:hypothetical protein